MAVLVGSTTPPAGNVGSATATGTSDLDSAIASYKAAADEAAAKSIKTAVVITQINGEANAIKKINPS
jgi:hypothetical protein